MVATSPCLCDCTFEHAPPPRPFNLQLEVIEGQLWGNVWQRECIARVNLSTGVVEGWVMLTGISAALHKRALVKNHAQDVLNGEGQEGRQGEGGIWTGG